MQLEANARPGLAIQIANNKGLLQRLEEIDAGDVQSDDRPMVIGRIGPEELRKSA
jgi:hypothetical protein